MAKKKKKAKQRPTKHIHKTKDRVTRSPQKARGELRCSERVSSYCFKLQNEFMAFFVTKSIVIKKDHKSYSSTARYKSERVHVLCEFLPKFHSIVVAVILIFELTLTFTYLSNQYLPLLKFVN